MGIKLSNNAFATLAASINSSATSITLTTGQGARFPTLSAGDYFYATLIDTSNNLEIVKCTARSTDVLTVVRAQESTTARAYTTGDRVEIRLTAATFTDSVANIGPTEISDKVNTSTGAMMMPVGTTAQRPAAPASGQFRYNSTLGVPEWYDTSSSAWVTFADGVPYNIEYLVVAGGGGGSGFGGGGGGAGGLLTASGLTVNKGNTYTITVGAGGSAGSGSSGDRLGTNGSNSSIAALVVAVGGGKSANDTTANGFSGGSGGGAGTFGTPTGVGGSGTSGQGNKGGDQNGQIERAGGGGGASAAGLNGNANSGRAGDGGAGTASSISGSSVTYAGGGGGGCRSSAGASGGNGGSGGGGRGSDSSSNNPGAGSANTGGGGGGARGYPDGLTDPGANGGSGIVIIRYIGSQRGSGGTVTSSGGYTIHTFTSSGTFTA